MISFIWCLSYCCFSKKFEKTW